MEKLECPECNRQVTDATMLGNFTVKLGVDGSFKVEFHDIEEYQCTECEYYFSPQELRDWWTQNDKNFDKLLDDVLTQAQKKINEERAKDDQGLRRTRTDRTMNE